MHASILHSGLYLYPVHTNSTCSNNQQNEVRLGEDSACAFTVVTLKLHVVENLQAVFNCANLKEGLTSKSMNEVAL